MAPAVRLSVVATGPFGRRVAELLPELDTDAVVAALWRPSPALCERLDAEAFRDGRPWLPIVYDNPHVRVGPLVRPPYGPCFRCYTARETQHDDRHRLTAAVGRAYDADPELGSAAFLPHHARLAAGLAAMVLGGGHDGQVLTADGYGSVTADTVVTCEGCPRAHPSPARARLSATLDRLFTGRARVVT